MLIDVNGLKDNVKPQINNAKKYLELGKNSINSINIPGDFTYCTRLRNIPQTLSDIYNKVGSVDKWVDTAINNFSKAENNNKSLMQSLISSSSLSLVGSNAIATGESVASIINNNYYLDNIKSSVKSALDYVFSGELITDSIDMAKKTASKIGDKIGSAISWVGSKIGDFLKATGASIANAIMGLLKGICQFIESLFDFLFMLVTGTISIFTGAYDGISYGVAAIKGDTDEWSSTTASMWKDVMGFVAEDYVGSVYKDFYADTTIGRWLDDNAVDIFKSDGIGTNIASGIGYIAGIVVLTMGTLGLGTAVTLSSTAISTGLAAAAGTGKATQEIWGEMRDSSWVGIKRMYKKGEISKEQLDSMLLIRNLTEEQWEQVKNDYISGEIDKDEFEQIKKIREMPESWKTNENLIKGLGYGVANGVWEGLQYYVGGKLAGWTLEGGSKLATSAIRIGADTGFNAMDTPFRAALNMLSGDSFQEGWEEQGGWNSVLSNIGIGLIGSAGGEIFDAIKLKRSNNSVVSNEVIDEKKLNRLSDIKLYSEVDETLVNQIYDDLLYKHNNGEINLANLSKKQLRECINNENMIIQDYLKTIVNESNFNKTNLVDGIVSKIPRSLDDLTKARILYLKLNQSVSYSDMYFAMNTNKGQFIDDMSNIYSQRFNIEHLSTNSIICSNWSDIYSKLLLEAGIEPQNIHIIQHVQGMSHQFVAMDLPDGRVLLADATNNISGMTDLVNSKLGIETAGFIITTADEYMNLKNICRNEEYVFRELGKNNDQIVKNIDNIIGYSEKQYVQDFKNVVNNYNYNANVNTTISINDKIDILKEVLSDNDYGAIESYTLSREIINNIAGNDDIKTNYYVRGKNVINVVTVKIDDYNTCYLYKVNNSDIVITNNINQIERLL